VGGRFTAALGAASAAAPAGEAVGVVLSAVVVLITGGVPVPSGSGRCEASAELW
jgi:hypothetical protein